jgi:hypothetical protein
MPALLPASFKLQIDLAASKLQIFRNACGAFIFFFCSRFRFTHRDRSPSKNEPKKRRRHRIYSPDGVAAMWSRTAECAQNNFFDIGQQCPVTQKVIELAIGMKEVFTWYGCD